MVAIVTNHDLKRQLEALFVDNWLSLIFEKYPFATGIILFGSRVKGKYQEDSDIDIILNMEFQHMKNKESYKELNRFFQSLVINNIEVDVKVNFPTDRFFMGKGYVSEVDEFFEFCFEEIDLEHYFTITPDLIWDEMTEADLSAW